MSNASGEGAIIFFLEFSLASALITFVLSNVIVDVPSTLQKADPEFCDPNIS